ncbi:hypothetical protein LWC08_06490 [Desulfobaculum bizertense]|uniref:hypothetical protein n=1 Tax=Desulfobaculum bizertense TaxID=376490 RepID=UPI001F2EB24D|nr:hypothetical protein [Desulfobaculum bizertense]UIJ39216.1 hypothetical protein LWC08_06490 [Desulfobaculum bizertense]
MSSGKVFRNAHQIHLYLREQGWTGSYNKIRADMNRGLLRPRRGRGFTSSIVESYARQFLTRAVDMDPAQDAPVSGTAEEQGVSGVTERRALAHARKLEVQQQREQMKLQKELGELVETSVIEEELAVRAKAFRLGLESFGLDASEQVAAVFGGEEESARRLLDALNLGEDMIPVVIDFALSCTGRFRQLWERQTESLLDPYATGTWWTDAMREAWEKHSGGSYAE